jgi:hypothetical protein
LKTVVIYESLFGNTHLVAEHVAEAAGLHGEVVLVPVGEATSEVIDGADLLVVGGPTHVHGLTWSATRHAAEAEAAKHDDRTLDPDAEGPGLRTWFHGLGQVHGTPAAAFDTRFDGPAEFTGRASKGIGRRLRHHGFSEVAEPESFLVDKDNHLLAGESDRARRWADGLVSRLTAAG